MEIDLLFTAVNKSDWKTITETGNFEPASFTDEGVVWCFQGNDAENIINQQFEETSEVLLVVIDPLRIQTPIKNIKENGVNFVAIQGTFSIDAIIDKITLQKGKDGKFSIRVKHFD